MDATLFERLLWTGENETLDFKRDQYPFAGATDDQKSELLKDILAFANSWRNEPAYILVGVEEVKGARSLVHGVRIHLDDHALQQFVSGKTQKPVDFRYYPFTADGRSCGVIEILVQERPVFLARNYGRLDANVVYIRRGSSTDQAKPSEVARMGVGVLPVPTPALEVRTQPRVERHPNYRTLDIAAWLFNAGKGTAHDVTVVLTKFPPGVLGFDYETWLSKNTGHSGTGLALKHPLHPGEHPFIFSVGLGVAQFQNPPGSSERLIAPDKDLEFTMKLFARNQPSADLAATFTRTEVEALTMKTFAAI